MPQLPSGRNVCISADPILGLARKGYFALSMRWIMEARTPADIAPLINVCYFRTDGSTPNARYPDAGEPYLSGLMMADIGTAKCDWPAEDQAAFKDWIASPPAQGWLQTTFDELAELIRTVKPPLPRTLHGLFG